MAGETSDVSRADLARAARVLAIRSRREVRGMFSGAYASAFRGGGMEFDESRPYTPGDDVRALDWNAMARTGEPFVKHFREERDQTLVLALDVSASMRFGTSQRNKGASAAHAAALLAAAAGGAGDRVGLLTFAATVGSEVAPARGTAHTWRVIEEAAIAAGQTTGEALAASPDEPTGGTFIAPAVDAARASLKRPGVVVLLSDFRDPTLLAADTSVRTAGDALTSLNQRHDIVSIVLYDPREESLPRAGLIRVADPESPGETWLLNSNRARSRSRYRRAWAARAAALERTLRAAGSEVVWLRSDRDPLRTLARFFRARAARGGART